MCVFAQKQTNEPLQTKTTTETRSDKTVVSLQSCRSLLQLVVVLVAIVVVVVVCWNKLATSERASERTSELMIMMILIGLTCNEPKVLSFGGQVARRSLARLNELTRRNRIVVSADKQTSEQASATHSLAKQLQ